MVKKLDVTDESVEEVVVEPITTIAHDFQREDLNELRDKLNAVIEAVNNLLD